MTTPWQPLFERLIAEIDHRQSADWQAPPVTLDPATVQPSGGSGPHPNIQPVLALNYIIALQGIFPSRG